MMLKSLFNWKAIVHLRGPVLIESNSEYLPDGISFTESLIATPE